MNLRFFSLVFTFTGLSLLFTGCDKEYDSIEQQDDKVIREYIQNNNLAFQEYAGSGIYYQVIKSGTGAALEFSKRAPVVFSVRSVNTGFVAADTLVGFNRSAEYFGYLGLRGVKISETIPRLVNAANIKKGGSIRLLIPSHLSFGKNPSSRISFYNVEVPGNSCLDVTMNFVDDSKQAEYDDLSIQKYMEANNLSGFTKHASGTYYKISNPGSTNPISLTSTLVVEYTGKLLNGFVFDSSPSAGVSFQLSQLIVGWQQTLPLIQEGGAIELIVPSDSAYGLTENTDINGNVQIPAFSSLYFTLKVTKVTN